MIRVSNIQTNRFGTIDCEIDHPALGWIPFTASPVDLEPFGRELYSVLKDKAQTHAALVADDLASFDAAGLDLRP